MKKQITIISLLLMGLLLFSMTPLIFRNYASAYPGTCAANFLPTNFVDTVDTANELKVSQDVANYIVYVLNNKYPTYDCRDAACTNSTFYSITAALQNWERAVIYSKGHLDWKSCTTHNIEHMGLAMYNGNSSVWDHDIPSSTKNVHTFIWHCRTALIPSGTNPDTCGNRGLPVAFTSKTNIPLWGTSGTQVYLGWNNKVGLQVYNITTGQYNPIYIKPNVSEVGSPQYEWGIKPGYNYSDVAILYYQRLGQGDTTADALIYVANTIWGTTFAQTPLNNWLVVYGNMYVALPRDVSYPYVSSIAGQTVYGYGAVNNPNGLKGSVPDGDYVQLYGGNYGDGANIVGQLNTASSGGNIWMYAYSGNGYYTRVYTFVSNSNNGPWTQTKYQTVIGTGLGGQWINCGSYNGNFQYVAIAAINESGYSAKLFVDAVEVRP